MKKVNLLFLSSLILLSFICTPALASTLYVDDDGDAVAYKTIGDALTAAVPGDTILIQPGTYSCFNVNKPHLTIQALKDDGPVVVDMVNAGSIEVPAGGGNEDGTGTIIDGLTIINSPCGIRLGFFGPAPDTIIRNCVFDGMTSNIQLESPNCTFANNRIQNNLDEHTAVNVKSASARIVNNTFVNIPGSNCALYIRKESPNATIENNLFENCTGSRALTLQYATGCTIANNIFKDNVGDAIRIWKAEATNNTITRNTFTGNGGIICWREAGDNNRIFLNTFTDTGSSTIYDGTTAPITTYWNSPEPVTYTYNGTEHTGCLGNFWSDYAGTDDDGDGVIDTPYELPDSLGTDNAPLMAAHTNYPPVLPHEPETLYVDDDGGADFDTIQAAVIAAYAGDTIVVKAGAYSENVLVDKQLTILSEDGSDTVTVTATTPDLPVFDLNADGIIIEGFSVRGPTNTHVAGIEIVDFNDCEVRYNDCAGCYNGIHIGNLNQDTATGNIIEENYCHENNRRGISLRDNVTGNTVYNNTCRNNAGAEICLKDTAHDNIVWANTFDGEVEIMYRNIFHSAEQVTYTYGDTEFTGSVGNYYTGYTGEDGNGDGIGDTPMLYDTGTYKDEYPMMGEWNNNVIHKAELVVSLYHGTVSLPDETFSWTDSNGNVYEINWQTPHGALEAAAADGGFTYDAEWKVKETALLNDLFADNIWYKYGEPDGFGWNYQVNGVYKDYFSTETGISNFNGLKEGDVITYYFGPKNDKTTDNAVAVITITVNFGSGPDPGEDWVVTVKNGNNVYEVDKAYFESGVGCGHVTSYTDADGDTWAGMPLYFLMGLVDDDNSHGADAFNRDLAAQGYSVEVTSGDGYSYNFASADVADNENIFVANTLNGAELPAVIGDKNKPCWPLRMSGSEVFSGKLVGNIVTIELIGVPGPEVESDMTLSLQDGWNFVSTPRNLAPGSNTVAIFGDVDSAGHSVYAYSPEEGWQQMTSTDALRPLDGIWLYSNGSADVSFTFDTEILETPPVKRLSAGWNAVGFSDTTATPARDALTSVKDDWAILMGFDSGTQAYTTSVISGATGSHADTREMQPGDGYWLFMRADGTLAAISA